MARPRSTIPTSLQSRSFCFHLRLFTLPSGSSAYGRRRCARRGKVHLLRRSSLSLPIMDENESDNESGGHNQFGQDDRLDVFFTDMINRMTNPESALHATLDADFFRNNAHLEQVQHTNSTFLRRWTALNRDKTEYDAYMPNIIIANLDPPIRERLRAYYREQDPAPAAQPPPVQAGMTNEERARMTDLENQNANMRETLAQLEANRAALENEVAVSRARAIQQEAEAVDAMARLGAETQQYQEQIAELEEVLRVERAQHEHDTEQLDMRYRFQRNLNLARRREQRPDAASVVAEIVAEIVAEGVAEITAQPVTPVVTADTAQPAATVATVDTTQPAPPVAVASTPQPSDDADIDHNPSPELEWFRQTSFKWLYGYAPQSQEGNQDGGVDGGAPSVGDLNPPSAHPSDDGGNGPDAEQATPAPDDNVERTDAPADHYQFNPDDDATDTEEMEHDPDAPDHQMAAQRAGLYQGLDYDSGHHRPFGRRRKQFRYWNAQLNRFHNVVHERLDDPPNQWQKDEDGRELPYNWECWRSFIDNDDMGCVYYVVVRPLNRGGQPVVPFYVYAPKCPNERTYLAPPHRQTRTRRLGTFDQLRHHVETEFYATYRAYGHRVQCAFDENFKFYYQPTDRRALTSQSPLDNRRTEHATITGDVEWLDEQGNPRQGLELINLPRNPVANNDEQWVVHTVPVSQNDVAFTTYGVTHTVLAHPKRAPFIMPYIKDEAFRLKHPPEYPSGRDYISKEKHLDVCARSRYLPDTYVVKRLLSANDGTPLPCLRSYYPCLYMLLNECPLGIDGATGSGKTILMSVLAATHDLHPRVLIAQHGRSPVRAAHDRAREVFNYAAPGWLIPTEEIESTMEGGAAGVRGQLLLTCSVDDSIRGPKVPQDTPLIAYMTTGACVRIAINDPNWLRGFNMIMLDELHQRNVDTDMFLAMVIAEYFRRYRDGEKRLKLAFASATGLDSFLRKITRTWGFGRTCMHEWDPFKGTITAPPVYRCEQYRGHTIHIPNVYKEYVGDRVHPVWTLYPTTELIDHNWNAKGHPNQPNALRQAVITLFGMKPAKKGFDNKPVLNADPTQRAILERGFMTVIFLSGSGVADKIMSFIKSVLSYKNYYVHATSYCPKRKADIQNVRHDEIDYEFLDSNASKDLWKRARSPKPGRNGHLILIVTSVAEASITLPGCRTVISTCYIYTSVYSPELGCQASRHDIAPAEQLTQQGGRAGRVTHGIHFTMLAEVIVKPVRRRLPLFADMQSSGMEVLLTCARKHHGMLPPMVDLDDEHGDSGDNEKGYVAIFINNAETVGIYPRTNIIISAYQLVGLGMFNDRWRLTPLGWIASNTGIDPNFARQILKYPPHDPRCILSIIVSAVVGLQRRMNAEFSMIAATRHNPEGNTRARVIVNERSKAYSSEDGPIVSEVSAFIQAFFECILPGINARARRTVKHFMNVEYEKWEKQLKDYQSFHDLSVEQGHDQPDNPNYESFMGFMRVLELWRDTPPPQSNDPIQVSIFQKPDKHTNARKVNLPVEHVNKHKSYPCNDDYNERPYGICMGEYSVYTPHLHPGGENDTYPTDNARQLGRPTCDYRLHDGSIPTAIRNKFEMNRHRGPLPLRDGSEENGPGTHILHLGQNRRRAVDGEPVIPSGQSRYRVNGDFPADDDAQYVMGPEVYANAKDQHAIATLPELLRTYDPHGDPELSYWCSKNGISQPSLEQVWKAVSRAARGKSGSILAHMTAIPKLSPAVRAFARRCLLRSSHTNVAFKREINQEQMTRNIRSGRPFVITAAGHDSYIRNSERYGAGPFEQMPPKAGQPQQHIEMLTYREGYLPENGIEFGSQQVLPQHASVVAGHVIPKRCYMVYNSATTSPDRALDPEQRDHTPEAKRGDIVSRGDEVELQDFTIYNESEMAEQQFESAKAFITKTRVYSDKLTFNTASRIPTGRLPRSRREDLNLAVAQYARFLVHDVRSSNLVIRGDDPRATPTLSDGTALHFNYVDFPEVDHPSQVRFGQWTKVTKEWVLEASTEEQALTRTWLSTASPHMTKRIRTYQRNDPHARVVLTHSLEPSHMLLVCIKCNSSTIWHKHTPLCKHECCAESIIIDANVTRDQVDHQAQFRSDYQHRRAA